MRWPSTSFPSDFLRFNWKLYWVWHRAAFVNSVCIYSLRTGSGGALQGCPIKDNHYEQLNKDFTLVSDFMLNQTASALTVKHSAVFGLVGRFSLWGFPVLCALGHWRTTSVCLCVFVNRRPFPRWLPRVRGVSFRPGTKPGHPQAGATGGHGGHEQQFRHDLRL